MQRRRGSQLALAQVGREAWLALGGHARTQSRGGVDDVFDDVFSLQAAVTIDTDPGRTYLVQVGGFGFFGMGDEEEDSGAEYGLLRVRVH